MSTTDNLQALSASAYRIRRYALQMGEIQGQGYIGQALGYADVLAVAYRHAMNYRPHDPEWEQRDRFLLSHGHYAIAHYAALVEAGIITEAEMETYGCDDSRLMARFDALLGGGTRVAGEGAVEEAALEAAESSDAGSPVVAAFPNANDTLNQLNGRDLRELIVQNEAGYLNLMRLVSRTHLEFKAGAVAALPLAELAGARWAQAERSHRGILPVEWQPSQDAETRATLSAGDEWIAVPSVVRIEQFL